MCRDCTLTQFHGDIGWVVVQNLDSNDQPYELHTQTLPNSTAVPVRTYTIQRIRRIALADAVVFGHMGIIRHKCTYILTAAALQSVPDSSLQYREVVPKKITEGAMVHNYFAPFDYQHFVLNRAAKIMALLDTETISDEVKLLLPLSPHDADKTYFTTEVLEALRVPMSYIQSYRPTRHEYHFKQLDIVSWEFPDFRYDASDECVFGTWLIVLLLLPVSKPT
jgi:hypothetical protein